jgi:sn1-specific diacylglycerol lipase
VGLTSAAFDHAFFGGSTVASPILGVAVSSVISIAEQAVLVPIFLGEYITSTSLIAAHSSINVLSVIIPGSSEASFSLASFITLVKREWKEPAFGNNLPAQRYGITQIARALVAWVVLQGVTQEWQEKRWFLSLREVRVEAPRQFDSLRERRGSHVRVTSDVIFPGNIGQIISADFGVAPSRARTHSVSIQRKGSTSKKDKCSSKRARNEYSSCTSNTELKATLRRLSKMVLAGYGGASLLFFGISPTAPYSRTRNSHPAITSQESQLTTAIDASEAEAAGELPPPDDIDENQYSWWDILLGKHDQEIFERFANHPPEKTQTETKTRISATAVIGTEHLMPRFWVLTDHSRAQIVLVIRGLYDFIV